MYQLINEWIALLKTADALLAVPLLVAAGVLMVFGWRLWRVSVVATFALAGGLIGRALGADPSLALPFALVGALGGGIVGYASHRYGVALIAGAVCAGVLTGLAQKCGFHGPALWLAGILGMLTGCGLATLNLRLVSIFLAATQGSILLISALIVLMMSVPAFYGSLADLANYSSIMGPFFLLVPTVMSSFYQMSEARRFATDALTRRRCQPAE